MKHDFSNLSNYLASDSKKKAKGSDGLEPYDNAISGRSKMEKLPNIKPIKTEMEWVKKNNKEVVLIQFRTYKYEDALKFL